MNLQIFKASMKMSWSVLLIFAWVYGMVNSSYMPVLLVLATWVSARVAHDAVMGFKVIVERGNKKKPKEPSRETAFWKHDPDLW